MRIERAEGSKSYLVKSKTLILQALGQPDPSEQTNDKTTISGLTTEDMRIASDSELTENDLRNGKRNKLKIDANLNSMIEPEDGGPESPVNKGISKRSRLAHLEKTFSRQEAYLYLFELSDSDDEFAENFSEVPPQKQKHSDTSSV